MLRALGLYLTKSTQNALWIAFLCGCLSVFSIPVVWIGLVIVGLITLHEGYKNGFLVWVAFSLPAFVQGFFDSFSIFIEIGLYRGLVVWFLAYVLTQTSSWVNVLRAGVILGILGVIAFYVSVDDVSGWWIKLLNVFLGNAKSFSSMWGTPEQMQLYFERIAGIATGLSALWFLALDIIVLLLARGWQAALYNPGGLKKEFFAIRMSRIESAILFVCMLAAWFGLGIARDFLPLLLLPFALTGFALLQVKIASRQEIKTPLQVGFYILLILFFSYMVFLLAFVGVVDSWYDFRARGPNPDQV